MSINPYQAPAEAVSTDPRRNHSVIGIKFESDWSDDGIRQRLKERPQGQIINAVFALLSAGLALVVLLAALGVSSQLPCLAFFLWGWFGLVWFSAFIEKRNGVSPLPGLAGPVRGELTTQHLILSGRSLNIVSKQSTSRGVILSRCPMIKLPAVAKPFPLSPADVTLHLNTAEMSVVDDPMDTAIGLVASTIGRTDIQERGEGTLLGRDLKPFACYRKWLITATVLSGLTVGCLATALGIYSSIPDAAWNYPPGYVIRDQYSDQIMWIYLAAGVGTALGLWAAIEISKLFRNHGQYVVVISPESLTIADRKSKRVCTLHNESLGHFRWTAEGLVVEDTTQKLLFVMPSRWFSQDQQLRIEQWSRSWPEPLKDSYYGPKI